MFLKTRSFKKVILFAVICYGILLGWGLRNYFETGYIGISSVSAINTYRYNACALEAKLQNKPFLEMQKIFDEKLNSFKTQKEQAEFSSETGWKIILEHPLEYSIIQLKTSLNALLPSSGDFARAFGVKIGDSGTLSVINSQGIVAGINHYFSGNLSLFLILLPLSILLVIEYILALIGSVFSLMKSDKALIILLLITALYFIFVGGPASTPRFRIPAEPIIFIFAVYGIKQLLERFKRSKDGK